MPDIKPDCLALLPEFNSEDLKQYAVDVFNRARTYDDLTGTAAIKRAQEDINKEWLANYYNDAQIKINNVAKFNVNKTKIDDGITVRQMLVQTHKNLSSNVESAQRASMNKLYRTFYDALSKEDVAFLQKADNQMDVANAFDGKRATPQAEKIAKQFNRYIDERNADMVNSNAMRLEHLNKDRFLKAAHDASKLINGGRSLADSAKAAFRISTEQLNANKRNWINFIKQHLDLEKTYSNTKAMGIDGKVIDSEVDAMLGRTFDNITTGKSDLFTKSAAVNDREAMKRRARMFFVWKDMRSFVTYNQKYGHGDLNSALSADLHASGNKIGMAQVFGESPANMYLDLKYAQDDVNKKGNIWWFNTDNMYKDVVGESRVAVSPGLAQFGGNLRSYTAMARLGGLLFQSFTDANMAASYAARWDINYGRAFVNQFDSVLRQYTDEEKKQFGKLFHISLNSHIGYMGRFMDAQNISALTQKVSTGYYRAIGMESWDKGNRIGIMQMMSKHLSDQSDKPFDLLSNGLKKQLSKFEISPQEWDLLRSKTKGGYFTTDNVDRISQEELKSLYNNSIPLHELRNTLYRKVFSIFDVGSQNAIVTPGAFERAFMNMGTRPGTIPGEAMRMFMQFKGFPLGYLNRMLINGWRDADGVQGKIAWALHQFGLIMPLSYLSTYMFNIGQGKTMPDPSHMSVPEKINFYGEMMLGAFGSTVQILDPQQQNQNLVMSLLTTPSMRLMGSAISTPLALATGNPKQAGKSAVKGLQYATPIGTIPFASPYIKTALGEEPYLVHGQQQAYAFTSNPLEDLK